MTGSELLGATARWRGFEGVVDLVDALGARFRDRPNWVPARVPASELTVVELAGRGAADAPSPPVSVAIGQTVHAGDERRAWLASPAWPPRASFAVDLLERGDPRRVRVDGDAVTIELENARATYRLTARDAARAEAELVEGVVSAPYAPPGALVRLRACASCGLARSVHGDGHAWAPGVAMRVDALEPRAVVSGPGAGTEAWWVDASPARERLDAEPGETFSVERWSGPLEELEATT